MIAGAVELDAGGHESAESIGERWACGIQNRKVVQPRRSMRRRRSAKAFPRVKASGGGATRRNKCRSAPVSLGQFEAEDTAVEVQGSLEIGQP